MCWNFTSLSLRCYLPGLSSPGLSSPLGVSTIKTLHPSKAHHLDDIISFCHVANIPSRLAVSPQRLLLLFVATARCARHHAYVIIYRFQLVAFHFSTAFFAPSAMTLHSFAGSQAVVITSTVALFELNHSTPLLCLAPCHRRPTPLLLGSLWMFLLVAAFLLRFSLRRYRVCCVDFLSLPFVFHSMPLVVSKLRARLSAINKTGVFAPFYPGTPPLRLS